MERTRYRIEIGRYGLEAITDPNGSWEYHADAQATVEALQRERDEWRSNVVAQEARANDLERDCKDLLSDIDGERAKVGDLLKKIAYWEKRHSTYRELAEENMNLKSDELSALQGLVRALQRERDEQIRERERYFQLWMQATEERNEMRKERDEAQWPNVLAPAMYDNPDPGWKDTQVPDLTRIWGLAREVGYAVGLHGSLKRDMDLIAVPWAEEAVGNAELIDHLCKGLPAVRIGGPEHKPHKRVAVTLQMDGYFKPIDLSIVYRTTTLQAALDAEREKAAQQGRYAVDLFDEIQRMKKAWREERTGFESDLVKAQTELSQLQALVSGMKSIIPHQHCRTCNQYADELRNYDIWGKRTLDATTPNSNQLGAINDMVRKEATVSEAQRMQNEMNGLVEIYRLKGELLELRDERDRLRANLINCSERLAAYYGDNYPAVVDAKAALTPAGGGQDGQHGRR